MWVVNWGALWVIIPLLAGRASRHPATAFALPGALGAVEVVSYYGVENLHGFKVAWIVIGCLFSALAGPLGFHARRYRRGLLVLPGLMVLEPAVVAAAFLVLGRGVGPGWFLAGVAEVLVGVLVAALLCV